MKEIGSDKVCLIHTLDFYHIPLKVYTKNMMGMSSDQRELLLLLCLELSQIVQAIKQQQHYLFHLKHLFIYY